MSCTTGCGLSAHARESPARAADVAIASTGVGGASTVCDSVSLLAPKPFAPAYVAVSVRMPVVVRPIAQLPCPPESVPVQVSLPSVICTDPLGVPVAEVTVNSR